MVSRRTSLCRAALALLVTVAGALVLGRLSAAPVEHTVGVGTTPLALVVAPSLSRLFVAYGGDNTVRTFDAGTGALIHTSSVGRMPDVLAVDVRRDRVYVVNSGDSSMSLLDARTGVVARTLAMSLPPEAIAVDEATDRVFVLISTTGMERAHAADTGSVRTLHARTGLLLHLADVGRSPTDLAVDQRTGRVFVTNGGSASVSVLDAHSGALLGTVTVGSAPASVTVAVSWSPRRRATRSVCSTRPAGGCWRPRPSAAIPSPWTSMHRRTAPLSSIARITA